MDFKPFPKIPRLKRGCVISEKIDGTNAQINFEVSQITLDKNRNCIWDFDDGSQSVQMYVGSRNKWITPDQDNYGFAKWAFENKEELWQLGPGQHFGEWWGNGIQRNYGLKEKKFSLFNTGRWSNFAQRPKCCDVVPVLYAGEFTSTVVDEVVEKLRKEGSVAQPGWMDPEGVIVYLPAANNMFKVTCKNDEQPKGFKESNGSAIF